MKRAILMETAQAGLGLVLIFSGGGAIALAGGAILFAWELAEMMREDDEGGEEN